LRLIASTASRNEITGFGRVKAIDEPSRHLWTLPEEMDESLEKAG
jgi:hypothetical protein